jgi:glycosyltransferase involved in cell wall biosynthesis
MRITFVLPYAGLQGGVRVVAIYAERLKRWGHEVLVVSTPQTVRFRRRVKSLLLGQEWCADHSEPSYFEGTGVEHRILERVRPVTNEDIPDGDVVIATFYTTARGVLGLSPAKGAKAILIQNYEVEEGKANPELDATWRMRMHKIVISKWLQDFAREKFGDAKASLVPYGIDFEQFDAPPREKQKNPTVGLLYAKNWYKGCRTSFAALKMAEAELSAIRLIAFGAERPGPIALKLPPGAEFHFRPAQDKLKDLYRQCDVWLCGSNREGFHMPPMEAMACRCPVVSTRVGGPVDMVKDGVNGYLADIGDAGGLAKGLLKTLKLPREEWKKMSDAAYETARHYAWDDATHLFAQALDVAVERNRRGEFEG